MDTAKAQQAKTKAKARKQQTAGAMQGDLAAQSNIDPNALAMVMQQHAQNQSSGDIVPEITAHQIALQTPTVNPYHRMGTMPANVYSPGNIVHGGLIPGC